MAIFDLIGTVVESTKAAKDAAQKAREAAAAAEEAANRQQEAEDAVRDWFENLIPTMPWEKKNEPEVDQTAAG